MSDAGSPPAPIEELERDRCVELLAGEEVGRLAVVVGSRPEILPVNYVLDGDGIVIRTAEGTKLHAAAGAPVAFEVDGVDRARKTGWSVVVHGIAHEVQMLGRDDITARLDALEIHPWAGGAKPFILRIAPISITGRRVGPG
jgi:nitroimidazol reductase NimA-like FMN-containing flavoprotein (pyridoxamine 5'-phosphate oxidase superfamily)